MEKSELLPVYWLPKAHQSRARQLDFLARRNPERALHVGDALTHAVRRLSSDPDLSRFGRVTGARELSVAGTPFLLVYRIEDDAITILRLLHHRHRFVTYEDAAIGGAGGQPAPVAVRIVESMTKSVSDLQARIAKLPRRAQRDMESAVQILVEEFAKARATSRFDGDHHGDILKIILFGSYARGKQVIDPVGRYFSDYDLLVVVDDDELTDAARYWAAAEDRMVDMLSQRGWPQPLNLIIHTIDDVNYQLRRGRYFWVDVVREGIALFERPGFQFEKPGQLTQEQARQEAERYFIDNFTGTARSLKMAGHARRDAQLESDGHEQRRWRNEAAFNLHQAMERAYHCIMLVLLLYQPKSHNLNFLSKRAEQLDDRLIGVWKTDTKFGKRCYELLRAAYIKSRYSEHYKINDEELDWLTARICDLQTLTRAICEEHLAARH